MPRYILRETQALLGGSDPADVAGMDIALSSYFGAAIGRHPLVTALLQRGGVLGALQQVQAGGGEGDGGDSGADSDSSGSDSDDDSDSSSTASSSAQDTAPTTPPVSPPMAVFVSTFLAHDAKPGTTPPAAVRLKREPHGTVTVSASLPCPGEDGPTHLRSDPVPTTWASLHTNAQRETLAALGVALQGTAGVTRTQLATPVLPSDLHVMAVPSWSVSRATSSAEAAEVVAVQDAAIRRAMALACGCEVGDSEGADEEQEGDVLSAWRRRSGKGPVSGSGGGGEGGPSPQPSHRASPPASETGSTILSGGSASSSEDGEDAQEAVDVGAMVGEAVATADEHASLPPSLAGRTPRCLWRSLATPTRRRQFTLQLALLAAVQRVQPPEQWCALRKMLWNRRRLWLTARALAPLQACLRPRKGSAVTPNALRRAVGGCLREEVGNSLDTWQSTVLPLVPPPPRRSAWVSLRRNFFQDDDTTLHYKPYFGDDDERELDLSGYSHSKVATVLAAAPGAVAQAGTLPADVIPQAASVKSQLTDKLHRSGTMGSTLHQCLLPELVRLASRMLGFAEPPQPPSHPMATSRFKPVQRVTRREGVSFTVEEAEGQNTQQAQLCLRLLAHTAADPLLRVLLFPGVDEAGGGSSGSGRGVARAVAGPPSVCLAAIPARPAYCSSDFVVLSDALAEMGGEEGADDAASTKSSAPAGRSRGRGRGRSRPRAPSRATRGGRTPPSTKQSPASPASSGRASPAGAPDAFLVAKQDVPLLLAALLERWRGVLAARRRLRLCETYNLLPTDHPLRLLRALAAGQVHFASDSCRVGVLAQPPTFLPPAAWLQLSARPGVPACAALPPLLRANGAAQRVSQEVRDAFQQASRDLGDAATWKWGSAEAAQVPHRASASGVSGALQVPSAQPWSAFHELGIDSLGVRTAAAERQRLRGVLDALGEGPHPSPTPEAFSGGTTSHAEGDGSHETFNVIFCPMTKLYDDRQHGVLHALPHPRETDQATRKRITSTKFARETEQFLRALHVEATRGTKRPRSPSRMPSPVAEAVAAEAAATAAASERFGTTAAALADMARAVAAEMRVPGVAISAGSDASGCVLTPRQATLIPRLARLCGGDVDAVCALLGHDFARHGSVLAALPRVSRAERGALLEVAGQSQYAAVRRAVSAVLAASRAAEGGGVDAGGVTPELSDTGGALDLTGDVPEPSPTPSPLPSGDSVSGRSSEGGMPPPPAQKRRQTSGPLVPRGNAATAIRGGGASGAVEGLVAVSNDESVLTRDARRLMSGEHRRVRVGRSFIHGWGAFLDEPASARDLLYEYRGELISQNEADRRGNVYDRLNMSYLFELSNLSVLDAARKGSKIRFANHSSNPNCVARIMGVLQGQRRIAFFARRDIADGDELTFNYQYETDHSSAVRADGRSGRGRGRGRGRGNRGRGGRSRGRGGRSRGRGGRGRGRSGT